MLIERIKAHNIINGFTLSITEFLCSILLLIPIAWYYVLHQKQVFAFITIGILVNCLPVIFFGSVSWIKKEKEIGVRKLFTPKIRKELKQKYPHMFSDTLIIVTATLIPFAAISITIVELIRKKSLF